MPQASSTLPQVLPHAAPMQRAPRLLLYAIRRMGAHGLRDAHAANAMLGTFGQSYRRPLILLRAFMAELARASQRHIVIAGCCCARMTGDEAQLIGAITLANADRHCAHDMLAALTGVNDMLGALSSAQAVEQAFGDLGRPLG